MTNAARLFTRPADRTTLLAIGAFLPGTFFGLSNFVQTALLAPALPAHPLALLALFLLVFNLLAPALVLGTRWLASSGGKSRVALVLHPIAAAAYAVAHLLAIALLVSWIRVPADPSSAFPMFAREIVVTCLPVWLAVYSLALLMLHRVAEAGPARQASSPAPLALPIDGAMRCLHPGDICHAHAQGNYVALQTAQGRLLPRITLAALRRHLPEERFMQVHRSVILRLDCIEQLSRTTSGSWQARMHDGTVLPVSRERVARLRQALSGEEPRR